MAIYEYQELKGVIKVGHRIRAVPGKNNPCNKIKNDGSDEASITEVNDTRFFINGCLHSFDSGHFLEIINKSNLTIMQKLNAMMRRLLDADTKKLIKAGLINGDLLLTDEGKESLTAIVFEKNKAELLILADEIIAEGEKQK